MSLCTSIPATCSCTTLTCGHLLQRHHLTGTGTPPARAPGQYRRLTHAHAAAAGVTRQGGSRPIYRTATNGPYGDGHDRRQPSRACTFRPRAAAQAPENTPARHNLHPPAAGRDPVSITHGRATQWLMISIGGDGPLTPYARPPERPASLDGHPLSHRYQVPEG